MGQPRKKKPGSLFNNEAFSDAVWKCRHESRRTAHSLRDVSAECGVSAPTLSRIERGGIPDVEIFFRLCKWINMNPEKFMRRAKT